MASHAARVSAVTATACFWALRRAVEKRETTSELEKEAMAWLPACGVCVCVFQCACGCLWVLVGACVLVCLCACVLVCV